ncbi:hypothetical protein A3I48_02795 [Candidatus Daviesbacteria bacterium RIFCSPLOWO2_02_FULL_36_7]|uniref:Inositolphosphotransferase Aur1/Ipt1 domain-containing protein n=1 Tax=Candidatus Daviesbacteria bacterium RIFCSPLOWO2_02_FULL_36_7 TaxID=1797792 RepID=A0A1F5MI78_9BACT|nr:MAG: hypothetical protein A3I48_02795 [Candidatus Daviesbacteria bacterium RIFCSPLOWO2_02_FULL_36_7]
MGRHVRKITLFVPIAYIIVVSIFLFWHRVGFSPDQFFAVALLVTLIIGRSKQFVLDWSVPVVLFLSYDYLRGLLPKLTQQAHIFPMINFDKAVFGAVPTNNLQGLLFSDGAIHWYDYLATVLYMSHFVVPMVVAFLFWLKSREDFRDYSLTLLIVSYAAFFTFLVFPAMPPWMAAQKGLIPEITKIMDQVFANLPQRIDLPSFYKFVGANLVAAVPSLHAAYPVVTFFFLARKFKRVGWLFLLYVLSIWFSIVYLGEHYVFDIVIGAVYASLSVGLVMYGGAIWRRNPKIYNLNK